MTTDFRSAAERDRDARHKRVCDMYVELLSNHPSVKPARLMSAISNEVGLTAMAIRNILIAYGLYSPKPRTT